MSWKASRGVVERFATQVFRDLGSECTILVVLPWTTGRLPPGILAPSRPDATLAVQEIRRAVASRHSVLVPCTFEYPEEEVAAHRILPQFTSCENVCVFIVHLLPEGQQINRQTTPLVMKRHEAMLATGVDDVFLNPPSDGKSLRREIGLARTMWELNVRRMQLMLNGEPEPVTPERMCELQDRHQRLLWQSIPRMLMPHFAPMDPNLTEAGNQIGSYRVKNRFETVAGTVLQAISTDGKSVAVKVIDKARVCTPGELEGLYREFRFCSEIVKHPNVVKCLGMMHSAARVYLVFEFAGSQNLAQAVAANPQRRFAEDESLSVFGQVSKGLGHCHSVNICHRSVSLQHIVISASSSSSSQGCRCRLVDFHTAMVSRGNTLSRTVCGTLPSIAPEMAVGEAYVPWRADVWSLGVVLLEMAGGLGTMHSAIQYDPAVATPRQVGGLILAYFGAPGSHERALSVMSGVRSAPILRQLQALLSPKPRDRPTLHEATPPTS